MEIEETKIYAMQGFPIVMGFVRGFPGEKNFEASIYQIFDKQAPYLLIKNSIQSNTWFLFELGKNKSNQTRSDMKILTQISSGKSNTLRYSRLMNIASTDNIIDYGQTKISIT